MSSIEVFDPPMCCSSGVCGPAPDERLARFSADLDWLKRQGVEVRRYNLAQEPAACTAHAEVKRIIDETGGDGLPVIVVDGCVVSQGDYPARDQLARWTGVDGQVATEAGTSADPSIPTQQRSMFNERIAELVAIGAAIAADCEPCLKYHHRKAVELGIHPEDMIRAVNVALQVKETPARMMVQLAQRLLAPEMTEVGGGCCGPGQSCG